MGPKTETLMSLLRACVVRESVPQHPKSCSEDSPVTTEFLTTMSGQLQNVQHVIDDAPR